MLASYTFDVVRIFHQDYSYHFDTFNFIEFLYEHVYAHTQLCYRKCFKFPSGMCPTVVVIYVTQLCINQHHLNYVAVTFVLFLEVF